MKEEDSIKGKEYPEEGESRDYEKNTVKTRIRLVIKFKNNIYKNQSPRTELRTNFFG